MSKPLELNPLWYLDHERSLFVGPLGRNESHRHSTPVFLTGLYGSFALRVDGAEWIHCRTAAIPAGVAYEFDMRGEPLAVLYLEPSLARAEHLAPLARQTQEVGGALVGGDGDVSLMREIYEDRDSVTWLNGALDDLVGFMRRKARPVDPRVSHALKALSENYRDLRRVGAVAASVGLSASRFQHVFTQDVGVPFRRYRAWCRMRAAIGEVVKGRNLTTAAHSAGFADQAHFARDFRKMFGAPASPSLAKVRRDARG